MTKYRLKKCFKCAEEKPRTEFYNHPQMADGLLGKCKSCTKKDVRQRRRTNPKVQEYDRERAKKLDRRAHAKDVLARWKKGNLEKYRAITATGNAIRDGKLNRGKCDKCGTDKNVYGVHPDHSRLLEVIWRCAKCHHRARFEAMEATP